MEGPQAKAKQVYKDELRIQATASRIFSSKASRWRFSSRGMLGSCRMKGWMIFLKSKACSDNLSRTAGNCRLACTCFSLGVSKPDP